MANRDHTIERNYLQNWKSLIEEYEAIKAGRCKNFHGIGDFYRHHRTCSQTFRKYYNRYLVTRSSNDLLPKRRGPKRRERSEAEDSREREAVFRILHSPPSEFGFNRTTWKTTDLQQALMATQVPLTRRRIRSIIKDAGYRWRKAKKVLTSSDPEYRAKLDAVQSILLNLNRDEGFFSIDEFRPLAITKKGGRKLVGPNDEPTIPLWQRSKGTLIVTAALELSTNQVTHFNSERKNTDEVIKLLDLLLERHPDLCRLYLSWDAASWHMSKRLTERIRSNNVMALVTGSTRVEVAPLPARAQFLNVIESVFSGMARAVIHNSNYTSVDEAKRAIDRYLTERNEYFRKHPKSAGNGIWAKERQTPSFSESFNHKDPRYR